MACEEGLRGGLPGPAVAPSVAEPASRPTPQRAPLRTSSVAISCAGVSSPGWRVSSDGQTDQGGAVPCPLSKLGEGGWRVKCGFCGEVLKLGWEVYRVKFWPAGVSDSRTTSTLPRPPLPPRPPASNLWLRDAFYLLNSLTNTTLYLCALISYTMKVGKALSSQPNVIGT